MKEVIIDGKKFELPDRKVDNILDLIQTAYERNRLDKFYTVTGYHKVMQLEDEHKPEDEMDFYLENYFTTEFAAYTRLRVRKTEAKLREYAMNNNEKFKSEKVALFYDDDEKEIRCGKVETTVMIPGVIWFSNETIAQAAVETVGRERVEEYLKWEFK